MLYIYIYMCIYNIKWYTYIYIYICHIYTYVICIHKSIQIHIANTCLRMVALSSICHLNSSEMFGLFHPKMATESTNQYEPLCTATLVLYVVGTTASLWPPLPQRVGAVKLAASHGNYPKFHWIIIIFPIKIAIRGYPPIFRQPHIL